MGFQLVRRQELLRQVGRGCQNPQVSECPFAESQHLEDHHRAYAETGYGYDFDRSSGYHHRQGRPRGRQTERGVEETHRQGDPDQYLRGEAS